MYYHHGIVNSIGRTPLVRLNRIPAGLGATIALKGEFKEPLGSVMIEAAVAVLPAMI